MAGFLGIGAKDAVVRVKPKPAGKRRRRRRRKGKGEDDGERIHELGQAHVQGGAIRVAEHRHRADAHAPCRANNAAGDFPAVGDEYFFKHRPLSRSAPGFS